jgi:iron complex transport system permease protein
MTAQGLSRRRIGAGLARWLLPGLIAATVLTVLAGLTIGSAEIGPLRAWAALLGDPAASPVAMVVQEIRLPRIVVGLMVGASLGLSGAALQGLLRNPLADPGVIGVSASAALGAVVALYYGLSAISDLMVPLCAMGGAMAATLLLYAQARRNPSILTLILVGVAINSLAGALTSLAMNLSPDPYSLREIIMWLLGSLANRSFTDVGLALPFMLVGWACLLMTARPLTALTLGEEAGQTLGVNLARTRLLVILGAALSVGAAVAVTGTVGFVGLVVPHMLRGAVGADPGRLLPLSAVGGALLVTLADTAIRAVPTDTELKLGVVTALIGGPFFIWLVTRTRTALR